MITLRRLDVADDPAFVRLRLAGASVAPATFRFDPEDDFARSPDLTRQRLSRAVVLGTFDGSELVGIGAVEPFTGRKLDHKWLLWGMYVATPGLGLGEQIVRALVDVARNAGGKSIQLTVMADNRRARALYERCGFSVYGLEPDSVQRDDGFADELLMRVVLDKALP